MSRETRLKGLGDPGSVPSGDVSSEWAAKGMVVRLERW